MNTAMKLSILGAVAALGLSACADGPGYGGPPGPGPMAFDAYYDGYYGPFDDGYWGDDGGFYYASGPDHRWSRDEGQHFRHDSAQGFNGVHFHGGPHTGAPHFPGGGPAPAGPAAPGVGAGVHAGPVGGGVGVRGPG